MIEVRKERDWHRIELSFITVLCRWIKGAHFVYHRMRVRSPVRSGLFLIYLLPVHCMASALVNNSSTKINSLQH